MTEPERKGKPFDLVYLRSSPLIMKNLHQVFTVAPLDVRAEEKGFINAITRSTKQLRYKKDFATVDRLTSNAILGFKVLHYSGHGLKHGLAFEDEIGVMHVVPIKTLQKLIKTAADKLKLVFVAACHSQVAGEAFVKAGVKHVIAVKISEKVADKGAQNFMNKFYLSLLVGHTVQMAFDTAKNNLEAIPNLPLAADEAGKYLLLPDKGNHNVRIFPELKAGVAVDCTERLAKENLPAPYDQFLGRNFEVQQVVEKFVKDRKRLITISGVRGIGKSGIAVTAARYLLERGVFRDGVYYFRFGGCRNMSLQEIAETIAENMGLNIPTSVRSISVALKNELRKMEVLLVMDGLDDLLDQSVKERQSVGTYISGLLRDCRNLKIMATCCHPIGIKRGVEEVSIPVGPMQMDQICQLFNKLTGDTIDAKKVGFKCGDGFYTRAEILGALAGHSLFKQIIAGHPGRCWEAASHFKENLDLKKTEDIMQKQLHINRISTDQINSNLHEEKQNSEHSAYTPMDATAFDAGYIKKIDAIIDSVDAKHFWHAFQPRLSVPFQEFKEHLESHFRQFVQVRRPLSQNDILTMCQMLQKIAMKHNCSYSFNSVSVDAFSIWWKLWYVPFTKTVKRMRDAWDNNLVMGVSYSKPIVHNEIKTGSVGSFMLRLSGNNPGCVVMGFVASDQPKKVMHVLIECVQTTGHFRVNFNDGKYQTYPSLKGLILQCKRVTVLYPQSKSKYEAFVTKKFSKEIEDEDEHPS
mmetsp:Transcript_2179/g.3147  ORF Transcript_2179/g.3147 Transcript_2179/m.3147 type:complete len:749 (-) Transcript_2179:149-2395(-)